MKRFFVKRSSKKRSPFAGLLWRAFKWKTSLCRSSMEGSPFAGLLWIEVPLQFFYGEKSFCGPSMDRSLFAGLLWRQDLQQGFSTENISNRTSLLGKPPTGLPYIKTSKTPKIRPFTGLIIRLTKSLFHRKTSKRALSVDKTSNSTSSHRRPPKSFLRREDLSQGFFAEHDLL